MHTGYMLRECMLAALFDHRDDDHAGAWVLDVDTHHWRINH